MFMGRCFYLHLVLRCTNRHKNKPIFSCLYLCVWCSFYRILYFDVQTGTKPNLFLVVYVYGLVLFVLRCTTRYQNKPISSCLCLWGGAFTRILLFGVQTDTKTSLFNRGLVVYVYGTMLLIATCTSVYKQAQKQPFLNCLCLWGGAFTYILYFVVQTGTKTNLFLVVYVYGLVLFVLRCTTKHQNKPISSCLCLWDGAFFRILYFDVQIGTETNLF